MTDNVSGDNNVAIVSFAGESALGSGNVFLGYSAGKNETGSNRLYIDNSDTATPLIFSNFSTAIVTINAGLGVNVPPTCA